LIEGILNRANEITLHDIEREKYFRIVASVIVDGQNLSDLLLAKKLAVPYDG
jgi:endonuclease YncB( thermonuclease family)|tara:strand:+ start:448 stop:603 length:156 start_codon:yes stop_codon:yes gene_type:complete